MIVPVLLVALRHQRRDLAVAVAVCSVAVAAMGVSGLRSTHRFADLVASVDAGAPGPDPVVVTTNPAVPRLAWSTFARQRWLLAEPSDLAPLVDRLRAAGIRQFTFVTDDLAHDGPHLGAAQVVSGDGRGDGRRWQILVLVTR